MENRRENMLLILKIKMKCLIVLMKYSNKGVILNVEKEHKI